MKRSRFTITTGRSYFPNEVALGTLSGDGTGVTRYTFTLANPGNVDVQGCGADRTAFIAGHEAGHYLGLFHTTESDGRFFDPLADTAKCPCIPCAAAADLPNCNTGGTAQFLNCGSAAKGPHTITIELADDTHHVVTNASGNPITTSVNITTQ